MPVTVARVATGRPGATHRRLAHVRPVGVVGDAEQLVEQANRGLDGPIPHLDGAKCWNGQHGDRMGRARVPDHGPPPQPQRQVGQADREVPPALEQSAAGGTQDLVQGCWRVDQPIFDRLHPTSDTLVVLSEVVAQRRRGLQGQLGGLAGRGHQADGQRVPMDLGAGVAAHASLVEAPKRWAAWPRVFAR